METYKEALELLTEVLQTNFPPIKVNEEIHQIPVGISNRHIHLSKEDLNRLFGEGYQLTKLKDLSQPGQYACKETLIICGPKGSIEKVRVLGPARSKTQIEILEGDCFKLGIATEARLSGDLLGTPGITLIGPKGSIQTTEGLIIAQRHIHMNPEEARELDVHDGQLVSIQVDGSRGGILNHVAVRVSDTAALECHIDMEEANALDVISFSKVKLIK